MSKKLRDILLSFDCVLFILLLAVLVTILISPLIHTLDIDLFDLEAASHLSKSMIQEDYMHLRDYLWIFHRAPLQLDYFTMSEAGAIHFADVKRLLDGLQVLFVISGVTSLFFGYRRIQKREYEFLKYAGWIAIFGPLGLAAVASVQFNQAFTLFHELFFSNDYWIFDARYDPVILILPEGFFLHCFLAIIILVVLFAIGLLRLYRHYGKKELMRASLKS